MQRLQAYKYELRPDGQQEWQMRRFAGACRSVFNKALALQKERHDLGEKKLGYAGLCKLLTIWRNNAASSRNPPKRLRGGSMPRLSAVGISGLQAGEDVKNKVLAWTIYAWF